jgi:hypothetical protein
MYFEKTQTKEFRTEISSINRSNSYLIALKFSMKTNMPFLRYSISKLIGLVLPPMVNDCFFDNQIS